MRLSRHAARRSRRTSKDICVQQVEDPVGDVPPTDRSPAGGRLVASSRDGLCSVSGTAESRGSACQPSRRGRVYTPCAERSFSVAARCCSTDTQSGRRADPLASCSAVGSILPSVPHRSATRRTREAHMMPLLPPVRRRRSQLRSLSPSPSPPTRRSREPL